MLREVTATTTAVVERVPLRAEVTKPARVMSVDVLRGLTIALMILVNDPGDWKHVFRQLDHAEWNGWTLTDLVFPTFLFLVGASMVFSFAARRERGNCRGTLTAHVFARSGKILLLGWVLSFFPRMNWHGFRLFGVLPRIALCYCLAGLILIATMRVRWLLLIAAALIVGYWALMRFVPVPGAGVPVRDFPVLDEVRNLAAWVDRGFVRGTQAWLHTGVLYRKTSDPEGLLSTLPAVATVLLGALAGLGMRAAARGEAAWHRLWAALAGFGVAGVVVGTLWSRWFPINKNLWTSTYVLLAGGIAAIVLALCSWLMDLREQPWPRWLRVASWPWLVLGSNAIAAYTVAIVFIKVLIYVHVNGAYGHTRNLMGVVYNGVFARSGSTEWTSLAFALCFVAVCFVPIWVLWRRRIFLKL